jgi:FKBP-type peptidyl-prolyl cis-trans isomerase FklB
MKKLALLVFAGISLTASAQVKSTQVKKTTAPKTTTPVKVLKTLNDSAMYAIGLSVINFYKQQGITKFNTALITKAITDAMNNKPVLMSPDQCNEAIIKLINQPLEAQAQPNIVAGRNFLAKNKTNPKIKTTPSGLQYEVIREGTGPKPAATDSVEVNYKGTLINGTEFDNSYKRGQSITFLLNQVIRGWTEGLQLMPAGSMYKLYIPYELGYGLNGTPDGSIPPGSTLIFEVELLRVPGK